MRSEILEFQKSSAIGRTSTAEKVLPFGVISLSFPMFCLISAIISLYLFGSAKNSLYFLLFLYISLCLPAFPYISLYFPVLSCISYILLHFTIFPGTFPCFLEPGGGQFLRSYGNRNFVEFCGHFAEFCGILRTFCGQCGEGKSASRPPAVAGNTHECWKIRPKWEVVQTN